MALALALEEENQPGDDLAPNAGVRRRTHQGQTSGMKRPAAADQGPAAAPKRRMRGKRPTPPAYGGSPANAAGSRPAASPRARSRQANGGKQTIAGEMASARAASMQQNLALQGT